MTTTDSNWTIIRDSLFLDTLYVTLRMKLEIVSSMNRASGCNVLSLLLIYGHKFLPCDSIISHSWNFDVSTERAVIYIEDETAISLGHCVPQECNADCREMIVDRRLKSSFKAKTCEAYVRITIQYYVHTSNCVTLLSLVNVETVRRRNSLVCVAIRV